MTKPKKTKSPKPKNVKGGVVIYKLFGDGSDTGATRLVHIIIWRYFSYEYLEIQVHPNKDGLPQEILLLFPPNKLIYKCNAANDGCRRLPPLIQQGQERRSLRPRICLVENLNGCSLQEALWFVPLICHAFSPFDLSTYQWKCTKTYLNHL